MSEYSHIHPQLRQMMALEDRERIREIREDRWCGYPIATDTLNLLEDLMDYPKRQRMPYLLIHAEPNNGKSSILKRFVKRYPPDDNPLGEAATVPVFFMEMPPAGTSRAFYQSILETLRMNPKSYAPNSDLEQMALSALGRCQLRMLVIDELHNFLVSRKNEVSKFLNVIRYLGNVLQVPIVCGGTPDALTAIQYDAQLQSRFQTVQLPPWENNEVFHEMLRKLETVLLLKKASELAYSETGVRILQLAERNIGEVKAVLELSAAKAIRNGTESITREIVETCGFVSPTIRKSQTSGKVQHK